MFSGLGCHFGPVFIVFNAFIAFMGVVSLQVDKCLHLLLSSGVSCLDQSMRMVAFLGIQVRFLFIDLFDWPKLGFGHRSNTTIMIQSMDCYKVANNLALCLAASPDRYLSPSYTAITTTKKEDLTRAQPRITRRTGHDFLIEVVLSRGETRLSWWRAHLRLGYRNVLDNYLPTLWHPTH